jgi:hypothetical protein
MGNSIYKKMISVAFEAAAADLGILCLPFVKLRRVLSSFAAHGSVRAPESSKPAKACRKIADNMTLEVRFPRLYFRSFARSKDRKLV